MNNNRLLMLELDVILMIKNNFVESAQSADSLGANHSDSIFQSKVSFCCNS